TGPEAPTGESGTTFALVVHLPTRNAPTPTRTITSSTNLTKLLIMHTSPLFTSAVFIPEAFFCMWLKPTDSHIQKDNSHGIRTSVPDQKSLLTESLPGCGARYGAYLIQC